MPRISPNLIAAVEAYFEDLRRIRASGGGTDELSYYPALTNLLNAVGGTLRPKVFFVSQLAQQGAGHPDFGLYAARQVQKGQPKQGQTPECGVVEVKPTGDDAWLTTGPDREAVKSLGWKWDKTRRTDPARISQHWLVLSVATLLTLAYGPRVEDAYDRRIGPGNLRTPPRALAPRHLNPWHRPDRQRGPARHHLAETVAAPGPVLEPGMAAARTLA